jgi:hypothetical protein
MECPRCRRPVPAGRPQCLYCGTAVSALAPAAKDEGRPPSRSAPSAIPGSALPARALVVVALAGVDAGRLAAAFGLSAFEARQWVRRGGYHLHRAAAPADAEAERERLAAQGIAAFTFDEATVRAMPERALGGRFDGPVLRVRIPGGPADITGPDLVLVVRGPITREHMPKESLRVARTATLDPGFLFHLHLRDRPRAVEIDPAAFEFAGPRAHEGSLLEIAGWITALAAATPVDDAFRRATPALAPAAPAAGLEDALRKSVAHPPEILDNVAQFRFYSAWRGAWERQVQPR